MTGGWISQYEGHNGNDVTGIVAHDLPEVISNIIVVLWDSCLDRQTKTQNKSIKIKTPTIKDPCTQVNSFKIAESRNDCAVVCVTASKRKDGTVDFECSLWSCC